MSSLSSIVKANSGLFAAQKGLQVTGHNITNVNTEGFTRQQLLQSDSPYITIGENGGNAQQVGLGVNQDEIRQIRDQLADKRLRQENSILSYYQKLNQTISDVESIFDEPYGDTITDMINDFWSQAQKLSTAPDGVEERLSFISTAKVLTSKVNDVAFSLTEYQEKLNADLLKGVNRVNEIIAGIQEMNEKIAMAEANGDNANDYRDTRNNYLDELSIYGEVKYFEEADHRVQVKFENHVVVNKSLDIRIEMKDITNSPFKLPMWSDSKGEVFKLDVESNSKLENDMGSLKAILVARGNNIATNETTWKDIALNDNRSVDEVGNAFIIPKVQKMLHEFVKEITSMVNSSFDGTGIGIQEGKDGVPVYIPLASSDQREFIASYEQMMQAKNDLYKNPNDAAIKAKYEQEEQRHQAVADRMLIAGNIQVNPQLLENGGYNLLGTVSKDISKSPTINNTGDNTIVRDFLTKWGSNKTWYNGSDVNAPHTKSVNIATYFSELVTDVGSQGNVIKDKAEEKSITVNNIQNERLSMGGVSLDEEFKNMLQYQYAYNASARMITLLDSMIDTIINKI